MEVIWWLKWVILYGYVKSQAVIDRTPMMYLLTAVIFVGMQLIGILAMSNPPEYRDQLREFVKFEELTQTKLQQRQRQIEEQHISPSQLDKEDIVDFYDKNQVLKLHQNSP